MCINLDNYIEGDFNPDNPANQDRELYVEEKELTIREALDTGFEDKLLDAVSRQEKLLAHIESELIFIRDYASQKHDTFLKNRITKLLKILE